MLAPGIAPVATAPNAADGSFSYSGYFWLQVPANNVVPAPGAGSNVPYVDQATRAAIRLGTIVEVPFTTPLFTSGSTQAQVQAQMDAQYAAAQAALNNAASPLAGIIGTAYTGGAWTSLASGLVVFDPTQKLIADVGWAAAAGLI